MNPPDAICAALECAGEFLTRVLNFDNPLSKWYRHFQWGC